MVISSHKYPIYYRKTNKFEAREDSEQLLAKQNRTSMYKENWMCPSNSHISFYKGPEMLLNLDCKMCV